MRNRTHFEIGQHRQKKKENITLTRMAISFLDIFKPSRTIVGEVEVSVGESDKECANHIADESCD
jgi:hypothetical protein